MEDNLKLQLPVRGCCKVMKLGRAVLTAKFRNAPCLRLGFVEMIFKWRDYSLPASTAFDAAARQHYWKIE